MVKDGQDSSKVMVFDGNSPQFAWETNNGSGIDYFMEELLDPDVVLTNDLQLAIVCYESLDREIILTLWEYNGAGTYSEISGNFGQYSFPHHISSGRNPNIDIGFDDEFVITWYCDDEFNIYAIAGEYAGGVIVLSSDIALIEDTKSWTPDVTVCGEYVTFTYIRDDQNGDHEWVTNQTYYVDVYAPPAPPTTVTGNIISIYNNAGHGGIFGRPRIASPPQYQYYPPSDFTTVVDYYYDDIGNEYWEILVFQQDDWNTPVSPIIYNEDFTLVHNYEPVVAYIGDLGVVCWTIQLEYPYNTNCISYDVVARYFQTTGGLGNVFNPPDAPVVNYSYYENQDIPSVAGRRWNDGDGFYFWRDIYADDMVHRTAYEGIIHMRLMPDSQALTDEIDEENDIEIQFNNDLITIYVSDQTFNYYITDVTGKMVLNKQSHSTALINMNELSSGIYFLVCYTSDNKKVHKFVKR